MRVGRAGANVLVSEHGIAKLADFGCSKVIDSVRESSASLEQSLAVIKGTVPFMAPEGVCLPGTHGAPHCTPATWEMCNAP